MKLFTVKTLSALAILSASMIRFAEIQEINDGGLMAEMMAKTLSTQGNQ